MSNLNPIESLVTSSTSNSFTHPLGHTPQKGNQLALGRAIRSKVPFSAHAKFSPADAKRNPLSILSAQAATRLPELAPIRYARMLASPFAFLRGAAAIMASDLAGSPETGLAVQACGDAHVLNFGVFASAERELVFGINDFDETYPAAWEWDLKRLVASAAVAARFIGGAMIDQEASARAASAAYRKHIREYAGRGALEIWYSAITDDAILAVLSSSARKRAKSVFAKARRRNHLQVLEKMTDLVNDQRHIVEDPPLIVRETHTSTGLPIYEALGLLLNAYLQSLGQDRRQLLSNYKIVDVARKVVGVGSVGTRCWVIFLEGANVGDPLFLQVKEAQTSVLAPFFEAPKFQCEGQRVVVGQRMIQGSPDIFLGWCEVDGTHFYIRQLRDMKGGVDLIPGKTRMTDFHQYCSLCGWALALAHAKSGNAALIAGYVGKTDALDTALGEYSIRYADQTDRDFETLGRAARDGKISVTRGS